jgi:hypothetical protein
VAFRNKAMTMPSIEDIIMQIMAMSEAFYSGECTIGRAVWDDHRPPNWPTALYILKMYGYNQDSAGWSALVDERIGIECKTFTQAMQESGEHRMQRRWQVDGKPDYTASPDLLYAKLPSDSLAVCVGTYQRTGRMILR